MISNVSGIIYVSDANKKLKKIFCRSYSNVSNGLNMSVDEWDGYEMILRQIGYLNNDAIKNL